MNCIVRKAGTRFVKNAIKRMADLGIIDSEIGFAEWENRQWEELSEAEKRSYSL